MVVVWIEVEGYVLSFSLGDDRIWLVAGVKS